ncbi:phage baseplate protein [Staphylococcus xylosus]
MSFGLITTFSPYGNNFILENEYNFSKIDEFLAYLKLYTYTHGNKEKRAHSANQITYKNQTIADFYKYLVARLNNLVLGHNGDGINEVKDARVDNQGVAHPTLHERLRSENLHYTKVLTEMSDEITQHHEEFLQAEYRFDPRNQEMQFITDLSPRTNAVMQSFWIDYRTHIIYMTQARPGGHYMLSRLKPNGQFIDRLLVKNGGHGTHNAYRYINGELWIYSSVLSANKKVKFVRFKYKTGEIKYEDEQMRDVMPHVFNNRYTTAIYNSKEQLMIFRREYTQQEFKDKKSLNFIEIRNIKDVDNNVDKVLYRFDIPAEYTSATQPMQGVTYDEGILYWYTGDSNPKIPNYLHAFDVKSGKHLWKRKVTIGGIDGNYVGNFQEAEGMAMYYDEETGKKALLLGVTTGPGNNRHHEIHSIGQRDLNDSLKNRATPVLMTDTGGRAKPLPAQGLSKLSNVTEIGHYYMYTGDTLNIKDFAVSKAWRGYGWFLDVLPGDINGVVRQVLTRSSFGRNTMIFMRQVDVFTGKTTVDWSLVKTYGEMWETPPKSINKLADLNIPGLEIYLTAEDTKRFVDFPAKYKGVAGFVYLRVKLSQNQYKEFLFRNNIIAPPETLERTTQGQKKSKWFTNAGSYKEVK